MFQWPHDYQRTVRNLTHIKHLKGSEFRHLLYYVLPVIVTNCFQSSDSHHFILIIVEFVRILSMSIVTNEDIVKSKTLVKLWLDLLPEFIDYSACTFNLHSLKHLPAQVHQFGATWSVNASTFESWLGFFKRLRTGNTNSLKIIMRRYLDYKTAIMPITTSPGLSSVISIEGKSEKVHLSEYYFSFLLILFVDLNFLRLLSGTISEW